MTRHPGLQSILIVAAAVAITAGDAIGRTEPANPGEIARLRAHFDSVRLELLSADVRALSWSQRAARATLIGRLAEYSGAGRFPHNHVVSSRMVPVFQDDHGTLCAMAYLIASTGRTDIVADVRRSNNLDYLPDLAKDARLQAWLDSTGLTVAEASRIQPSYGGGGCCVVTPPDPHVAALQEYKRASLVATLVGGSAAAIALTSRDATSATTKWSQGVGLVTGAAQFLYGAWGLQAGSGRQKVGVFNLVAGGATITAASFAYKRAKAESPRPVAVSVAPVLALREAGFVLRASF